MFFSYSLAASVGGFRPDSFSRNMPAWLFPVFVIPLVLFAAYMLFKVDVLAEVWNFFESLFVESVESKQEKYESFCLILNTLRPGCSPQEIDRALRAVEELKWKRGVDPGDLRRIAACLKQAASGATAGSEIHTCRLLVDDYLKKLS